MLPKTRGYPMQTELQFLASSPGRYPPRAGALRWACAAAITGLCLATSAFAAPGDPQASASTRPAATQEANAPGGIGGGRIGRLNTGEPGPLRDRLRERMGNRMSQEMDEQTWTEVVQFLKKNAPLRFKYFESLPEDSVKQRIRQALVNRYNMVQMVQTLADLPEGQKLYGLIVKRIQLDDQCWDLARQYRLTTDTDVQTALRQKLTALLTDWAANQLEERRIRIERLRQILDEESARLEKDQSSVEQFVNQNLDRVISDENFLLMAAPPRQMDGQHGPMPGELPMPPGMSNPPSEGMPSPPQSPTGFDLPGATTQPGNP